MHWVIDKISFHGWEDCMRVRRHELEIIIASSIGPRILSFGYAGGTNILYLDAQQLGLSGGDQWRIYGGHRLWHAPESMPRTYSPDNDPVTLEYDDNRLLIKQEPETMTGIRKEIEITLLPDVNSVMITHRLVNVGCWPVQLAPWALSVMAGTGTIIIPNEPWASADTAFQPTRSVAVWPYTNLGDKRWQWSPKYTFAHFDPVCQTEQKLGFRISAGWMAYRLGELVLVKTFSYQQSAAYPDMGSNAEVFIDGRFIEMETLGPLCLLDPGTCTEHIECWTLKKLSFELTETSIDNILLPEIMKV